MGEPTSGNTYAEWFKTQNQSYRVVQTERLVEESRKCGIAASRGSENLLAAKWRLATTLILRSETNQSGTGKATSMPLHAPLVGRGKVAQFIPIRFVSHDKLGRDARLIVAFDALGLSEALGRGVQPGQNHPWREPRHTQRENYGARPAKCGSESRKSLRCFRTRRRPNLSSIGTAPSAQSRARCWPKAIEMDDLGLLAGMSANERQKLRSKGNLHPYATLLYVPATAPAQASAR